MSPQGSWFTWHPPAKLTCDIHSQTHIVLLPEASTLLFGVVVLQLHAGRQVCPHLSPSINLSVTLSVSLSLPFYQSWEETQECTDLLVQMWNSSSRHEMFQSQEHGLRRSIHSRNAVFSHYLKRVKKLQHSVEKTVCRYENLRSLQDTDIMKEFAADHNTCPFNIPQLWHHHLKSSDISISISLQAQKGRTLNKHAHVKLHPQFSGEALIFFELGVKKNPEFCSSCKCSHAYSGDQ